MRNASPTIVTPPGQLPGPGLSRNPSSASGGRGTPSRGLSVRRPGMAPPTLPGVGSPTRQNPNRPSPTDRLRAPNGNRPTESRVTDFYDNYMEAYADSAIQSAPPLGRSNTSSRVGNWARNNANLPALPPDAPSRARSVAPSSYAPSSAGGLRRKTTRRAPRSKSMYEEEEEGYGSGGDYEETVYEMSKIRVKVTGDFSVRYLSLLIKYHLASLSGRCPWNGHRS